MSDTEICRITAIRLGVKYPDGFTIEFEARGRIHSVDVKSTSPWLKLRVGTYLDGKISTEILDSGHMVNKITWTLPNK